MASFCSGNLIIVASPSGGGKTTLVKKLIDSIDNIAVSISHTTRSMRPGEKEAVDYFFISNEQFLQMVQEQAFIEHAKVFNYHYGTSLAQIHDRLQAGIDVVLDIDWQGAKQIKHKFPESTAVFIIPPSLDVLKQRLIKRGQDKETVVSERMRQAQDELSHYDEFDYLIVNDEFDKAAFELKAIVLAMRLKMKRQAQQQRKLLSFLLKQQ